jgi:hypothetical protein
MPSTESAAALLFRRPFIEVHRSWKRAQPHEPGKRQIVASNVVGVSLCSPKMKDPSTWMP